MVVCDQTLPSSGEVLERNQRRSVLHDKQIWGVPGPLCFNLKFSSLNDFPYIDFPPVPSWLVKSPPCVREGENTHTHSPPAFFPITLWVSVNINLTHEVRDNPVKHAASVSKAIFPCAQSSEVFCSFKLGLVFFFFLTDRKHICYIKLQKYIHHLRFFTCSLWYNIRIQLWDRTQTDENGEFKVAVRVCEWAATLAATSMVILPRGSPSASMSRNTTEFFSGPERNNLAAEIPSELYLKRFFSCIIAIDQRTRQPTVRERCCVDVWRHRGTWTAIGETATPCGRKIKNNKLVFVCPRSF